MKTKLPLVLSFIAVLFFSQMSYGQEVRVRDNMRKVKPIIVDFKSLLNGAVDPILNVPDIKVGDYYNVQVKNINLNMFKIGINSIDSTLSSKQTTPTFGSLDLDNISKVVANISSSVGVVSSNSSFVTNANKVREFTDKIIIKMDFLPSQEKDLKPIADRMAEEKIKLEGLLKKSDELKSTLDKIKLDMFEFRAGSEGNPVGNSAIFSDPTKTLSFDFKKCYNDVLNLIKSTEERIAEAEELFDDYKEFAGKHELEIKSDDKLKKNNDNINAAYAKYLSAFGEIKSAFSSDKIIELFTPLIYLANNTSNTYNSLPKQFLGEQGKIKLFINPRDENKLSQKYYTEIVFPDEITTYTTVGLSLYGSSLYDESYSVEKITINDSVANYIVHPEKLNKMEIGVSMLLRYGKKFNTEKNIGVHGSLGAGMSIANKVKPRFLFGGGFSFGKKHMFAVDLGGIVGYSDRVNESAVKSTYDEVPTNVIYSKLTVGFFGGLGYIYQF